MEKWYQKTGGIVLLLVFFFPAGLYLMWKYSTWHKGVKIVISVLLAITVIGTWVNGSNSPAGSSTISADNAVPVSSTVNNEAPKTEIPQQEKPKPEEQKPKAEEKVDAKVKEPEQAKSDAPKEKQSETLGQKNALKAAENYLAFSAFSKSGLAAQLAFEGYTKDEANYAANNCGADWNEQAAKAAQNYLDFSSFSRDGLIDQLVYEGYTKDQAAYGAKAVGY